MTTFNRTLSGDTIASPNWQSPLFYTLDFDIRPPSIRNLPAALNLASGSVDPTFRYWPQNATTTAWLAAGYGDDLTGAGSGTYPTVDWGNPLLGDDNRGVLFAGTSQRYYDGGAAGNLSTYDFAFEIVTIGATVGATMGKGYYNAGYQGWSFFTSANTLYMYLNDGNASPGLTLTIGSIDEKLQHYMCFGNRNENSNYGFVSYVNNVAGSGQDISSRPNAVDPGQTLALGYSLNHNTGNGVLLGCSMWRGADIFKDGAAGPVEWAQVVNERFAELTGTKALASVGYSFPTVCTRSTGGYLDKIETDGTTKLYQVGPNWPRVCSRNPNRRGWNFVSASSEYVQASSTSIGALGSDLTGISISCLVNNLLPTANGTVLGSLGADIDSGYFFGWASSSDIVQTGIYNGGVYKNLVATSDVGSTLCLFQAIFQYSAGAWTINIYRNGQVLNGTPGGSYTGQTVNNSGLLTVGATSWGAYKFTGQIFEIQVDKRSYTATEVLARYNQSLGGHFWADDPTTVVHYKFNEESTSNGLRDRSVNGNHLTTISGTPDVKRSCALIDRSEVVRGYLAETGISNHQDKSGSLDAWSKEGTPTITGGQTAPDGSATAFLVSNLQGTGVSTIYQAANDSATGGAGAAIRASVWIKQDSSSGVLAFASANGPTYGLITIDLSTLPSATWVRLDGLAYGTLVTSFVVWSTGRSGSYFYRNSGASPLSVYLWEPQMEQPDVGHPTSNVSTGSSQSSATRVADAIRYRANDGNWNQAGGEIGCEVLLPNIDSTSGPTVLQLSNGAWTSEIRMDFATAQDFPELYAYNGSQQALISATTDVYNGSRHAISATCSTNNAKIYVDGVSEGTPDTNVVVPTVSQLDVGGALSAGYELNGLISKVRID